MRAIASIDAGMKSKQRFAAFSGFALLVALMVCAMSSSAWAQSVPAVSSGPALVLQRGQTQNVTLAGQHLARVVDVAIARARGLHVELVRPAPATQPTTMPAKKSPIPDDKLEIKLSADSDAVLGDREVRLVGPTGISAPLHVTISQYPHIDEREPNNSFDRAQLVELPAAITGRIDAPGDIDCFKFMAKRDQVMVFDVYAARSASSLEPVLAVHDADGHELHTNVSLHGADPTLIFTPPADGQYEIEIRDLEYRGGDSFAYRIDAGAIPYVESVMPMSAEPGKLAEVRTTGVNLQGAGRMSLDLTYAQPGDVSVRARAESGLSNEVPFEITDFPPHVERGHNHDAKDAETVAFPVEISGRLDSEGDEDFFKFHLDHKELVVLQAIARRIGSPVDPLLTLRNVKGDPIVTNDDSGGADSRITRELEAGNYQVSLRDLTFHGGPSYSYRLRIAPGAAMSTRDFSVRFAPDALRVSRGGNSAVMCDVTRTGGFKGDVTITLEGLPPGVTAPPVVLAADSSDIFTLSASKNAAVGTYPIQLRATATIDNHIVSKLAQPMLGNRPAQQAYLSVLDAAPFSIEAITGLSPQRVQQLGGEAANLAKSVGQEDDRFKQAEADWEKHVSSPMIWQALDGATAKAAQGTEFKLLPDGSFLATGKTPAKETYTVSATTHLHGITAIKLELFPDDSLPLKGPGRHMGDGNFVLSKFALTAASGTDEAKASPVAIRTARADFEQQGYPIIDAIEPKDNKGWANYPNHGKSNTAYFFPATAIGQGDATVLTFTLDQQFDSGFSIGRFRISVTDDPDVQAKSQVPADVARIAQQPANLRNAQEKTKLAAYYRTIDPLVAQQEKRLQAIYTAIGPELEMSRLAAQLAGKSPALDAGRAAWEQSVLQGSAWVPLQVGEARSAGGASLDRLPDESVLATGVAPPTDVYSLVGTTGLKAITGIRLEALPDVRLPGNGPGRAPNGNFVLTRFVAKVAGGPMGAPISFRGAIASSQQQGLSVLGALDERDDTGWAVLPNVGLPSTATFYPASPVLLENGQRLAIDLEQKFTSVPGHTLGRFRIWVTGNSDPDQAPAITQEVLAALRVPADKRDRIQRETIEAAYRAQSQALNPLRERLAELQSQIASENQHPRYSAVQIPVLVARNHFDGPIEVTLEGFSAGRRKPLAQNLNVEPLQVATNATSATLKYVVQPAAEAGSKLAVLRAQATIDGETYVEYSPAFPITVTPAR